MSSLVWVVGCVRMYSQRADGDVDMFGDVLFGFLLLNGGEGVVEVRSLDMYNEVPRVDGPFCSN